MKNPFGDQQIPGSYHNLKERLYKKVSAETNDQMFEMMMRSYENAINTENIFLSRHQRKQLFSQVITMIMEDMIKKLD